MANLMTMQSHAGFPYREPDMDHMAADMSNVYGAQHGWTPSSGFVFSSMPATHAQFTLDTNFQQERSNTQNNKRSHDMTADTQHAYNDCVSRPGSNLTITTSQQYPSQSMFTPTNALVDSQDVTTISPMQTRFDHGDSATPSNANFPLGRQYQSPSPSNPMTFSDEHQEPAAKRRCDSLQTTLDDHSPTTSQSPHGRRRRSEYAEPGSARAVYLEKNRKAASKCRSKQKMQQEELVETARDVERRNRALKAEVEFLKGGMRELMDVVGQHTACPDSRLRTYVQREADRLASDGRRPIQFSAHSEKSCLSSTGSPNMAAATAGQE